MEVVSFTVIFYGNTATFSEIYNKNLEHLEQKRIHFKNQFYHRRAAVRTYPRPLNHYIRPFCKLTISMF